MKMYIVAFNFGFAIGYENVHSFGFLLHSLLVIISSSYPLLLCPRTYSVYTPYPWRDDEVNIFSLLLLTDMMSCWCGPIHTISYP